MCWVLPLPPTYNTTRSIRSAEEQRKEVRVKHYQDYADFKVEPSSSMLLSDTLKGISTANRDINCTWSNSVLPCTQESQITGLFHSCHKEYAHARTMEGLELNKWPWTMDGLHWEGKELHIKQNSEHFKLMDNRSWGTAYYVCCFHKYSGETARANRHSPT